MNDLIGRSLDRYKLVALLGEGGMGAVFKASDITLQRDVAIKILHPQFARRPAFRERFLQEARTAARLRHPGIVKVFDFGQSNTNLYIVMEFIPGANLRNMLQDLRKAGQWIVLPEAVAIVQQISLALDYAHRQGVLHRDIKPDNIMLLPEPVDGLPYRPVVTDLGLAKLAAGGLVTQEGVSMGTPAYMSPEQAIGEKTDARSDVYSLGILLYEMAAGCLPFPVKTLSEAIRYHTKEPPPPPRSIRPDMPQNLERIILRAIAKQPASRFSDARGLADALKEVVPQARGAAAPPTAAAGDVSLMTRYQESMVAARAQPAPVVLPSQPPDLAEDRIVVTGQDGKTQTVSVPAAGLTIGRGPDNDLVLAQTAVSRHHARVEFDGTQYRVVDLNSTNGTHLENVRLLPGVPEVWTPEKVLRIGNSWLRLQRAAQRGARGERPDATAIGTAFLAPGTSVGRIGLFLQTPEVIVEAGRSAALQLEALNQGDIVDHVGFTVLGIPEAWVRVPSSEVRLMPGAQQPVTLLLEPPRSPESRHGSYPVSIRATSRKFPAEVAEVQAKLQVAAYYEFSLDLHPRRQSSIGEGRFRVGVKNTCNSELTFRFRARDAEDGCRYAFEPEQLTVPAGAARRAELTVRPKIEAPRRATKTYFFTVVSEAAEAPGLGKEVQGEWIQSPLALSLALEPQQAEGFSHGIFTVRSENQGPVGLQVNLTGASAERTCYLALEPKQLILEPGHSGSARLRVSAQAALKTLEPQIHTFQVDARVNTAPTEVRSITGQWTQTAPVLEVRLDPVSGEGVSEAKFQVQVTNREAAELEVQLSTEDPSGACRFSLATERVQIPANQQHSVALVVSADTQAPILDVQHRFAVVVRPVVAPALQWRAEGIWTRKAPAPEQQVGQLEPTAVAEKPARSPKVGVEPTEKKAEKKRHRFWALVCLLLGLAITGGLFLLVGYSVNESLISMQVSQVVREFGPVVAAALVGVVCLFFLFRVVRRLWRGY